MTVIVYRLYAFVHRFANGEASQRIRSIALSWSKKYGIDIRVEIIGYAVYIEFPDEKSLTIYSLTVEGITQQFQRVESIPE